MTPARSHSSFLVALGAIVALCLSSIFLWTTPADSASRPPSGLSKRFANQTAVEACKSIEFTSEESTIDYDLASAFTSWFGHYLTSSSNTPACLVKPTTADDLSAVMKVIAQKRINFAVSSGGHTGNPGFSSTKGIHISMKGFQHVKLSKDKQYVDVGSGNIWDNVYAALEGTGRNVVGGRATGVGVGGFILGGGGYSWLTNQYGLTVDTVQQFDMVLPDGTQKSVTPSSDPDLFWALKGGGNRFGVVYNFRLATVPQTAQVWGGLKTFTQEALPPIVNATAKFVNENKDPKAQIIPTYNFLLGAPGVSLLAFYDGPSPPKGTFSMFEDVKAFTSDWKARQFNDLVRSAPANATGGHRGVFHTVSFTGYSVSLLNAIVDEVKFYGGQSFTRSGFFISYDVEPFLKYPGKDAAWKHTNSPFPMDILFVWDNPMDDNYWRKEIVASCDRLTEKARAEGQKVDDLLLYPNYAIDTTPVNRIFDAASLQRLKAIRKKVDPANVMGLTTSFNF